MIAIVDYGVGNLKSIQNMLRKLGIASQITSDPGALDSASKLILPGVGAFAHGMERLRSLGFEEPLRRRVVDDGIPILGICLGMQLFSRGSAEGDVPGLGLLPAETVEFDPTRFQQYHRIPHMGWSDITLPRASRLFQGVEPQPRFYFVHSYHVACDDPAVVSAWASHGHPFVAALERGNIAGVQFHPEKSHRYGMALLKNFADVF